MTKTTMQTTTTTTMLIKTQKGKTYNGGRTLVDADPDRPGPDKAAPVGDDKTSRRKESRLVALRRNGLADEMRRPLDVKGEGVGDR